MGFLRHFKGVRFERGLIHFGKTDTDIHLNAAFFKSAWGVAKIMAAISARRLGRALSPSGHRKRPAIAFYPDTPGPWYNAYSAVHLAGMEFSSDIHQADHVFIFDDKTHSDAATTLPQALRAKAINHRISDISKSKVGEVFEAVFGYSVDVDPLVYHGRAVQKSEANAAHDGTIIDCPISADQIVEGYVYQKLIDATPNGQSEDLRFAYVGGEIVAVFHKFKDLDKRFGTDYAHVDVYDAADVFSSEEIELLCSYCEAMGLDFGAVDVMRDKIDKKIYVVDVNKTCMPVLCLPVRVQMRVFEDIASSLSRLTARAAAPT